MTSISRKRCAIYTRKSTEEGLEQDFNSLDAQREACGAYILSQAGEGWEPVAEHYNDGGWSGGNMSRPALAQLLADVKAGKVDIIVVYKVDRLTRSLADFAKIVEVLDEHGASFVSVTQAFNTTNSMGRLTLNVLLSFAQFEREVTGERIRDKIAASKKKGMWMGGAIPHGFYVKDRKLLIEPTEAKEVRYIFDRYLELKSVPALVEDLAAKDVVTRRRPLKDGRTIGGVFFGRGALAQMLKNPTYIGRIKHKDAVYDAEYEALIETDTFEQVQKTIAENRNDKAISKTAASPSLLAGRITDPDGRPMSPARGQKASKQYCYYVTRFKPGEDRSTVCRLPAGEVNRIVIESISNYLKIVPEAGYKSCKSEWERKLVAGRGAADAIQQMTMHQHRQMLIDLDVSVRVLVDVVEVTISQLGASDRETITTPAKLVRGGNELRMVLPFDAYGTTQKNGDPTLLKLVAQAFAARDFLVNGKATPLVEQYDHRHRQRLARVSWLAPDIISAILEGRQPVQLTARQLIRCSDIPLGWQDQRKFLGFASA
jgi:site-specific DNA recombinase